MIRDFSVGVPTRALFHQYVQYDTFFYRQLLRLCTLTHSQRKQV